MGVYGLAAVKPKNFRLLWKVARPEPTAPNLADNLGP